MIPTIVLPFCTLLPTCRLALAEGEQMLSGFITRLEKPGAEVGLSGEEIIIRSTGCPNRLRPTLYSRNCLRQ
jgi:sulfite reductase beta subunit-like hemoprotein